MTAYIPSSTHNVVQNTSHSSGQMPSNMPSQNTFAKNWFFGLATGKATQKRPSPLHQKLSGGLRWMGGLLVWLMLMLPAQAAVEMRGAAEHAFAAIGGDEGAPTHAEEEAHQAGSSVYNRGVDHLAFARALALIQRGEDTEGAIHRSAAEIADQILWEDRRFTGFADGRKRAGDRNVIDVMARRVSQRAILTPPCHTREDETRIGLE